MNIDAPLPGLDEARARVLGIQTKLHRWATDDPHRRFDDLFNLVCDPAFLVVARDRVQRNRGARSAGVDGVMPRSKAALAAVKAKVRTLTQGGTNQALSTLLDRINPVLRGWANYFRHGVSKATFDYLNAFSWRRVVNWLRRKHPRANWKWLRRRYLPGWRPTDGDVTLFNPTAVPITRYRYRGAQIPPPW